jgi:hypothetical protein
MINDASKELKNPPIEKLGTIRSTIIMVHAFTIKVSNPKVRRFKGKVTISRSGLSIIFARNMTNPMISRAFISLTTMVLMKEDNRYKVATIARYFNTKFFIYSPLLKGNGYASLLCGNINEVERFFFFYFLKESIGDLDCLFGNRYGIGV